MDGRSAARTWAFVFVGMMMTATMPWPAATSMPASVQAGVLAAPYDGPLPVEGIYGRGRLDSEPAAAPIYIDEPTVWTGNRTIADKVVVRSQLTIVDANITFIHGFGGMTTSTPGRLFVDRSIFNVQDGAGRVAIGISSGSEIVNSSFDRVSLNIGELPGSTLPTIVRGNRITGMVDDQVAIDVISLRATIEGNNIHHNAIGIRIPGFICEVNQACPDATSAPLVRANAFEFNERAVVVGPRQAGTFELNLFSLNQRGASCGNVASAEFRQNNFNVTLSTAYQGELGAGPGAGSHCVLESNYYSSEGGDEEEVQISATGEEPDPSPATSAYRIPYPEGRGPLFVPDVRSTDTDLGPGAVTLTGPIVVTGRNPDGTPARLRVTASYIDLAGGFLASRGSGYIELDGPASWTTVVGGSLLLANRATPGKDVVDGARFPERVPGRAIGVFQTAATLRNLEIRDQDVGIELVAPKNDQTAIAKNAVTITDVTIRESRVAIAGPGAPIVERLHAINNNLAIGTAIVGWTIRSSEFVGNKVGVFYGLIVTTNNAITDSYFASNEMAIVLAGGPLTLTNTQLEYNGLAIFAAAGAVSMSNGLLDNNLVAFEGYTVTLTNAPVASSLTLDKVCGSDDAVLTGGSSTATNPAAPAACPPAPLFAKRFTPVVVASGSRELPSGALTGPWIARRGATLTLTGREVVGTCPAGSSLCEEGIRYVVGAKPGGAMRVENGTLRNAIVGLGSNAPRFAFSTCEGCRIFAVDGGGERDVAGGTLPAGSPGTYIHSSFRDAALRVLFQRNQTTTFHRVLGIDSSLTNTLLSPIILQNSTWIDASIVKREDPASEPAVVTVPNQHSDLRIADVNFARNPGGAVSDGDDTYSSTPSSPIRIDRTWFGAACGRRSETCHGDPVSKSTVKSSNAVTPGPAPAPVVTNTRTSPLVLPPRAAWQPSLASPTTQQVVALTSSSYGLRGLALTHQWDFGDGNTSTETSPTHRFVRSGTYRVNLTVRDEWGAGWALERDLVVRNVAPNMEISIDTATPTEGLPTAFSSLAADPDGTVVNWTWTFPGGTRAYGPTASFTFPDGGTHSVQLSAVDDEGLANTTARSLIVAHRAPVAAASVAGALESGDFTFTDVSTHPNAPTDGVTSWTWRCNGAFARTGRNVTHRFVDGATYACNLTVVDNDGQRGFSDFTVAVGHVPPTPAFTAAIGDEMTPSMFTDASTHAATNDSSPATWSFLWDFGEAVNVTTRNATHRFPDGGSRLVTLRVTDNDGFFATTQQTVVVPHVAPVASFVLPANVQPNLSATFRSSATTPNAADAIVNWTWSFGDGRVAYGATVTHAYVARGRYDVTLTVRDDDGLTSSTTQSLRVGNLPPVAGILPLSSRPEAGQATTLRANATDPDGDPLATWRWRFPDGTTRWAPNVTHTFAQPGPTAVCLMVWDDQGASNERCETIGVDDNLRVLVSFLRPTTVEDRVELVLRFQWQDGTPAVGVAWSYQTWYHNPEVPPPRPPEEVPPPDDGVTVDCHTSVCNQYTDYFATNGTTDASGMIYLSYYTAGVPTQCLRGPCPETQYNTPGRHDYAARAGTTQGHWANVETAFAPGSYVAECDTCVVREG